MKVLDPGHQYELAAGQRLQFLKKQRESIGTRPNGAPVLAGEFVTVVEGTTTEEVLEVALDRLRTMQVAVPCRENALAITNIEQGLMWLERRTKNRQRQGVEGTPERHQS